MNLLLVQLNLAGGLEGSPLKSPSGPGQSASNPWKTNRLVYNQKIVQTLTLLSSFTF